MTYTRWVTRTDLVKSVIDSVPGILISTIADSSGAAAINSAHYR